MNNSELQESINRHPTSYQREQLNDSPSASFMAGWRSEPFYSDEEVAEREAEIERDESVDRGFYDTVEIPDACERCGGPFGRIKLHIVSEHGDREWSGATTVNGAWVCNSCEKPAWDEMIEARDAEDIAAARAEESAEEDRWGDEF